LMLWSKQLLVQTRIEKALFTYVDIMLNQDNHFYFLLGADNSFYEGFSRSSYDCDGIYTTFMQNE